MTPLKTNQRVMIWLCMCQSAEINSDTKTILLRYAFTLIVFTFMLVSLIVSLAYFVKFISINFEECLYALFQVAANFSMLNVMIVALSYRRRITDIFTKLSEIYVASKMFKIINSVNIS